jgi:MFS family permease
VIPAFLAVALLVLGVDEPGAAAPVADSAAPRFAWSTVRRLPRRYAIIVGIAAVLTLARFSEAFLVLRASSLGLGVAFAPLVMVVMSAVYSLTAYPAGRLADRMSHRKLLVAGVIVLVAADLVLAWAGNLLALGAGVVLWGLHMGLTQGLLSAMVAHTAPAHLRGTAFGVFNLGSGIAMLLASAIAGALWQYAGPAATFFAGAVFAALSAAVALRVRA